MSGALSQSGRRTGGLELPSATSAQRTQRPRKTRGNRKDVNTETDNEQKLEYRDDENVRRYLIAFAFFFAIVPVVGILHYIMDWPWLEATAAIVPQGVFATGILMSKRTVVVDIAKQTVIESYTLWFVWLRCRRIFRFSDFSRVLLSVWHVRGSVNFSVHLVTNEQKKVSVSLHTERHQARERAEELARAMGVDIKDESLRDTYEEVRIEDREDVQKREAERLAKRARDSALPVAPDGSRVSCCVEGNGLTIQIPARGIRIWHVLVLVAWVCSPLCAWLPIILRDEPPKTSMTLLYLLAGVGSVFLLALFHSVFARAVLRSATRSFDIRVSPDQLTIREAGYGGRRAFASSPGGLQEFRLVVAMNVASSGSDDALSSSSAILVRSESESMTFGQGLSGEELQWLKAVIEQVLAAGVGDKEADGSGQMTEDRREKPEGEARPTTEDAELS